MIWFWWIVIIIGIIIAVLIFLSMLGNEGGGFSLRDLAVGCGKTKTSIKKLLGDCD